MNYKIFVYGTLKRGYSNHRLLTGASFLCGGRTREKYALYTSGIPFVIKDEKISQIQGEIYLVDETTLANLDLLEGHPNWYCREKTEIILEEGWPTVTAWLYFYPYPTGKLLPEGVFLPV